MAEKGFLYEVDENGDLWPKGKFDKSDAITFDTKDGDLVRNVDVEKLTEEELMKEIEFLHMVRRRPETRAEDRVKIGIIIGKLLNAMLDKERVV